MAQSPIKKGAEDAVLSEGPRLSLKSVDGKGAEAQPKAAAKTTSKTGADAAPAAKAQPPAKQAPATAAAANRAPSQSDSVSTPRPYRVKPPVRPARLRKRHLALIVTFLLMVALPTLLSGYYLWNRAADQYASFAGFSVQREDTPSPLEIPGLGPALGGSSTSDPEILFEFLNSQTLVAELEQELQLSQLWSRPVETDPIFGYDPEGSIEDLLEHWERMVQIGYDGQTGLLEVRVLAFTPEDATRITQALLDRSSTMINALSNEAREDAIGYAREELEAAEERLTEARVALTKFRSENRLVDPQGDVAVQTGLLGNLEAQRAEAIIALDLLRDTANEGDPRVTQAQRRIEVIEARIEAELNQNGQDQTGAAQAGMADVIGEFERLAVDREFAEQTYVAARAAFDQARAEARRKSRYLATHVAPTTAETARYPQRILLVSLVFCFATLAWAIVALTAYSLRDRR